MDALSLSLALTVFAAPAGGDGDATLCAPQVQLVDAACPALGPGDYTARLAAIRLPGEIPPLPVERLARPDPVLDWTYARVTLPEAPLFTTPEDALAGVSTKTLGKGFIYVNLMKSVQAGDLTLYQIRGGEYIRAADVSPVAPSGYQGLWFTANPQYPFAWLVSSITPSPRPGAAPLAEARRLPRYRVVQIFGEQRVGEWTWYLIGLNQWVEQRAVGRVDLHAPPEGVSGKWIQVDLYEQTLAAYEDGRLVYASLVSSGLDKWATQPGLFQIYARYPQGRMRGAYEPDRSDYYYLEAVPYVMYFDGDRALHGQYWHDRLGFKRSHGCVNLAPLDARWLFDWAPKGTPVWVFDPSAQPGNADTAAFGP